MSKKLKSRKPRELPRKMNIEEVEEPKKYRNYHAKPVSDPFKTIAEHRKARELPGKMNIEEIEEPETTKIHIQNPRAPIPAKPKVREKPRKTNMQARKHVNSDEFRPAPRSSTPAFYYYRIRTRSVNHTVWGTSHNRGGNLDPKWPQPYFVSRLIDLKNITKPIQNKNGLAHKKY